MKIIINYDVGGYCVPDEIVELFGLKNPWDGNNHAVRTNPLFIQWVEAHEDETDLVVVEIPQEVTDYIIQECDGIETVLYVLDGKIYFAE